MYLSQSRILCFIVNSCRVSYANSDSRPMYTISLEHCSTVIATSCFEWIFVIFLCCNLLRNFQTKKMYSIIYEFKRLLFLNVNETKIKQC